MLTAPGPHPPGGGQHVATGLRGTHEIPGPDPAFPVQESPGNRQLNRL